MTVGHLLGFIAGVVIVWPIGLLLVEVAESLWGRTHDFIYRKLRERRKQ